MSSRAVKSRFTPSPAGLLYFGNVWTALCSVLSVRHCEGALALRNEDAGQGEFSASLQEDLAFAGGRGQVRRYTAAAALCSG